MSFQNIVITALVILLFVSMAMIVNAQWEEIPSEGTTIEFSGVFNDKANSFSGTAIHSFERFWVGVNGSQISSDAEVLSQDISARAQGGLDFDIASAQLFVESTRDMESDLTLGSGIYLRKVLEKDKLDIVLGAGTLFERDQVAKDLNLSDADASILPYYLGIIGLEYDFSERVGLYGKVVATPRLSFELVKGNLDFGADIVLDENLTLKVQSSTEFEGVTDLDTETSLILAVSF